VEILLRTSSGFASAAPALGLDINLSPAVYLVSLAARACLAGYTHRSKEGRAGAIVGERRLLVVDVGRLDRNDRRAPGRGVAARVSVVVACGSNYDQAL
jgi:hypothetical protein